MTSRRLRPMIVGVVAIVTALAPAAQARPAEEAAARATPHTPWNDPHYLPRPGDWLP